MQPPDSARPRPGHEPRDGAQGASRIVSRAGTECEPFLLDARDLADTLRCSVRHIAGLRARGLLPAPLRLGRRVLWRRAEVVAWLDAGAPSRERWAAMREAQGWHR